MLDIFDHHVPPAGPIDADIMIVGESPGHNEWKARRPFIGESGDLLNDALRVAGLRRAEIFITNVIKDDLPPYGDTKRSFFFSAGNPTKVYMDGIIALMNEINTVKPNVVVPLGNYALWALMQHEEIMKWRGSILESTLVPGQKVIPILHPAFYINSRNMWHRLPLFEWDFQRVAAESKFPDIRRPPYSFIVDPSPMEVEAAVTRYTVAEEITADTEWYGPNKLAYVGFADNNEEAITIPANSMQRVRAIREILRADNVKVWQNAAFDIVALHRQGYEVRG